MAASAPTTAIGYTQAPQYSQLAYEDETTPELQWPQSVTVYDQMRRTDSQVASVLRAVTLPVRRTPWRVDPNGARAEVVQLVADDLGLPIVGQTPKSLPRTKDRFSWSEHLRLALLMLPMGASYFEQVYRVEEDASRAHLRKLEWRPLKTIDDIDVAPDGGLISIKQYWTQTNTDPKPIPVSRLVAYVHEREGGNWLGQSVLRSAYKNWLLKDRLLRVQAQTIERNGMGIPVYEGAETERSLDKGMALTQSLRAGAAAGTAIPFGAKLRLMGVEGTLPDADPVVRYHDEQIARAVLAHFLNLGTQTGSWALGTTFADFFTLSLQTLAQQIADVATQHIIEDLVDVNFGEQEPAPRLVFDEIGSRQQATAQAIKLLVDAGLITPDQVLDETLRQQYGLPPADPATAKPAPTQGEPSRAPEPEPVPGEGSVAASAPAPVVAHLPGEHNQESHGNDHAVPDLGAVDRLKLARRIRLDPGHKLVSSRKVTSSDSGSAVFARIEGPDGPELRVGVVWDEDARSWAAANKGGTVKLDAAGMGELRTRTASMVENAKRLRKEHRDVTAQAEKAGLTEADPSDPGLTGEQRALVARMHELYDGDVQDKGVLASGPWGDLVYQTWTGDIADDPVTVNIDVRPNPPGDWQFNSAGRALDYNQSTIKRFADAVDEFAGGQVSAAHAVDVPAHAVVAHGTHNQGEGSVAASAPVVAHLPGEHNQESHGNDHAAPDLGALDKLKLASRIQLGEGERLLSSRKFKSSMSRGGDSLDLLAAEVDTPNGREVRLGIVDPDDSKRWIAGPDPKRAARVAEIRAERGQLDEDDPRFEELTEQLTELESEADDVGLNRTATLPPAAIAQLHGSLAEAAARAQEWSKAWRKYGQDHEAEIGEHVDLAEIERRGGTLTSEQAARFAELSDIVDGGPEWEPTFAEGTISAGGDGDLAYQVQGFDGEDGDWRVDLGIRPRDEDETWYPGAYDDAARFDPKDVKALLAGLAELAGDQTKAKAARAAMRRSSARSLGVRENRPADAVAALPDRGPRIVAHGTHNQKDHGRRLPKSLSGDSPFSGFSREQLRKAARRRGIELEPREDRTSIESKLARHLAEGDDSKGDNAAKLEPAAPVEVAPDASPARMTKAQYTSLLTDEYVRLSMLRGTSEDDARKQAGADPSIDDLKERNTVLRAKLRQKGVDYRTEEQKRTDDAEKNKLLDEVERLANEAGHDGPAKRAGASKMSRRELAVFVADAKEFQQRRKAKQAAEGKGSSAVAAFKAAEDKSRASKRQVGYIKGLLRERGLSGEAAGPGGGPTSSEDIRKLSNAEARAYINRLLRGDY